MKKERNVKCREIVVEHFRLLTWVEKIETTFTNNLGHFLDQLTLGF